MPELKLAQSADRLDQHPSANPKSEIPNPQSATQPPPAASAHAPRSEKHPGSGGGKAEDQLAQNGERPGVIPELIQFIHDGEVTVEQISVEERHDCIAHLTLEGFSPSEIAQLLHMNERTVYRDRTAVRLTHAMTPGLSLGDQLLGEFERIVTASVQRLTRLAPNPQTPAHARIWAEDMIVRNHQRLIQTAIRLNYVEEGTRRLSHQRYTDPAEQKREKDSRAGMMQTLLGKG